MDPAGGIQLSAILPEGSAVPEGGHGSQPNPASRVRASPGSAGADGASRRGKEDGHPRVHRLLLGLRGGEHCGDPQRARVGSAGLEDAGRGSCGKRAALAPARLSAPHVRPREPAPGR